MVWGPFLLRYIIWIYTRAVLIVYCLNFIDELEVIIYKHWYIFYHLQEKIESPYRFRITLTIRNLVKSGKLTLFHVNLIYYQNFFSFIIYFYCLDFGQFRCISKNSIGQAEEFIEVHGKNYRIYSIQYMYTKIKIILNISNQKL